MTRSETYVRWTLTIGCIVIWIIALIYAFEIVYFIVYGNYEAAYSYPRVMTMLIFGLLGFGLYLEAAKW